MPDPGPVVPIHSFTRVGICAWVAAILWLLNPFSALAGPPRLGLLGREVAVALERAIAEHDDAPLDSLVSDVDTVRRGLLEQWEQMLGSPVWKSGPERNRFKQERVDETRRISVAARAVLRPDMCDEVREFADGLRHPYAAWGIDVHLALCSIWTRDFGEASRRLAAIESTLLGLERKRIFHRIRSVLALRRAGEVATLLSPSEIRIHRAIEEARMLESAGDVQRACDVARSVADVEDAGPFRLVYLAGLLLRAGHVLEAQAVCDRLMEMSRGWNVDPKRTRLDRTLGQLAWKKRSGWESAVSLHAEGVAGLRAGDVAGARVAFGASLEAEPEFRPSRIGLALAHLAKGDRTGSKEVLAGVLSALPVLTAEESGDLPGPLQVDEAFSRQRGASTIWFRDRTDDLGIQDPKVRTPMALVDDGTATPAEIVAAGVSPHATFLLGQAGKHTGAGAAFFDYDLDGDLDLFKVHGHPSRHWDPGGAWPNVLYRNDQGRGFVEVGSSAGIRSQSGGHGVAVADYDADGDPDLLLTRWGSNVLYRNNGVGGFEDVTAAAGMGDPRYGTSAGWFDYDQDGWLDAYILNFVAMDPPSVDPEGGGRSYTDLWALPAQRNTLYRNLRNGRFADVTDEAGAGIEDGKSFALAGGDFDLDGDVDVYVANDMSDDAFMENMGDGTLRRVERSAGLDDPRAGMGVDFADLDGDRLPELAVSYFAGQGVGLFFRRDDGSYRDRGVESGLAARALRATSWGLVFEDFDNDGHVDLYVATGQSGGPLDRDLNGDYDLVFRNRGNGRFEDVSWTAGPGMEGLHVSRGVAAGDYDDDGDMDLFVSHTYEVGTLLESEAPPENAWVKVHLVGQSPNRDALGAVVELSVGGRDRVRQRSAARGYLSAHGPELHFGLGAAKRVDVLRVRWTDGTVSEFSDIPARSRVVVTEGAEGYVIRDRFEVPGRSAAMVSNPGEIR